MVSAPSSPLPGSAYVADERSVFLSHSSQDKADLVRPLAEFLRIQGITVWFDEFTLVPGDSLAESIDRGLVQSDVGVLVISPAFISTARSSGWTSYEYRGIVSNTIGASTTRLIPIWHGVDAATVRAFSPSLADTLAITTDGRELAEVAFDVMRVVAPDKARSLSVLLATEKLRSHLTPGDQEQVDPRNLVLAPRRSVIADGQVIVRATLVVKAMRSSGASYVADLEGFLDDLASDSHVETELRVWEVIAATYSTVSQRHPATAESRKDLANFILLLSLAGDEADVPPALAPETVADAAETFFSLAHVGAQRQLIGRDMSQPARGEPTS